MVDPIANEGLSKLLEQADKAGGAGGADGAGGAGGVGGSDESKGASFDDVLEDKMDAGQVDGPQATEGVDGTDKIQETELDEMQGVDSATSADGTSKAKLEGFVEGLSDNKAELEEMLERSVNGETMDQKELLEMQSLIYAYSQKVELASKVVEKGTGGLKQMMQMRV